MGHAIHVAQMGGKVGYAKPLKGCGSGVLEVVDDFDGDTYRAVYVLRFADAVYVVHAFKKKSVNGIETPKQEMDLVEARLKLLEAHLREEVRKPK